MPPQNDAERPTEKQTETNDSIKHTQLLQADVGLSVIKYICTTLLSYHRTFRNAKVVECDVITTFMRNSERNKGAVTQCFQNDGFRVRELTPVLNPRHSLPYGEVDLLLDLAHDIREML